MSLRKSDHMFFWVCRKTYGPICAETLMPSSIPSLIQLPPRPDPSCLRSVGLIRSFSESPVIQEVCSMPKYLIERELPGAGKLSPEQLRGVSQKSCSVLNQLGPQIQWIHSYVTGDKIYCVYRAPNEEMICY